MLAKQDRHESSQLLSMSLILKTSAQKRALEGSAALGSKSWSRSGNWTTNSRGSQRRLSWDTEEPVAFVDAAKSHLLAEKTSGNTSGGSNMRREEGR